jgi:hypothetical protein
MLKQIYAIFKETLFEIRLEERKNEIASKFVLLWEVNFKSKLSMNMIKRAIHGYNECYSVSNSKTPDIGRRGTLVMN